MRQNTSAVSALLVFVCMGTAASSYAAAQSAPSRPNILWIVSEDNGPFLGCYGDSFAKTPRLDRFASEGILYRNAFSNAPVCAPTRFTLITGVYAPSAGTQHMRSRNAIPPDIRLFPKYLRDAGYYCTNRSKTDYNLTQWPDASWDEIRGGHYKNRKPGQPFFSVFNITTSHEGQLHSATVRAENLNKPFTLPPYHPDTPEIRSNWVDYYGKVSQMDSEVGAILDELEASGLAEDTIVFYFSDHGGILPRSKRFLFDTGVRVPLIIRFPEKYQHLAPSKPGSKTDRLVSFVDFAPTVLSLLGVKIPEVMQGRAFLGPKAAAPHESVYLFRGRMDERYDMSRATRDKRYKYVRNYMPHRVYGQHLNYLWRMAATRSWEEAYQSGKCNAAQSAFWEAKPTEELYDTEADPWEVHNLVDSPGHQAILERLRAANRAHLLAIRDAGFMPEADMIDRARATTVYEVVRTPERYPLEECLKAAELAGERNVENLTRIDALMQHSDSAVRYWAATGCAALGKEAEPLRTQLEALLADRSASVRIAAAEALLVLGNSKGALGVLSASLRETNPSVVLHALNVAESIGDAARGLVAELESLANRKPDHDAQRASERTLARLRS